MDKKAWYIYTMEYYSAIQKNTFESVLMRWMKLEPFIQSEFYGKRKTEEEEAYAKECYVLSQMKIYENSPFLTRIMNCRNAYY